MSAFDRVALDRYLTQAPPDEAYPTRRRQEYRLGRDKNRRGYGLTQCETPTERTGWLREYERKYGYIAAMTYLEAWRELQAGVYDPYAEGGYKDDPGYSESLPSIQ